MTKEEKLEEAKRLYKTANADQKYVLESLFPELKESEDEKTKRVLHSIANKMSQHLRDIFSEEEFQCYDAWSNAWLERQGGQKSAWSVEDEAHIDSLLKRLEGINKPGAAFISTIFAISEDEDWLKSLKDRVCCEANCTTTWKPSEEQISLLKEAVNIVGSKYKSCLNSLYSDLKKL